MHLFVTDNAAQKRFKYNSNISNVHHARIKKDFAHLHHGVNVAKLRVLRGVGDQVGQERRISKTFNRQTLPIHWLRTAQHITHFEKVSVAHW